MDASNIVKISEHGGFGKGAGAISRRSGAAVEQRARR
jgi:hypothetical protein